MRSGPAGLELPLQLAQRNQLFADDFRSAGEHLEQRERAPRVVDVEAALCRRPCRPARRGTRVARVAVAGHYDDDAQSVPETEDWKLAGSGIDDGDVVGGECTLKATVSAALARHRTDVRKRPSRALRADGESLSAPGIRSPCASYCRARGPSSVHRADACAVGGRAR